MLFPRPQNLGHSAGEHFVRLDADEVDDGAAEVEDAQSVVANFVGPEAGGAVYPHGFEPVSTP